MKSRSVSRNNITRKVNRTYLEDRNKQKFNSQKSIGENNSRKQTKASKIKKSYSKFNPLLNMKSRSQSKGKSKKYNPSNLLDNTAMLNQSSQQLKFLDLYGGYQSETAQKSASKIKINSKQKSNENIAISLDDDEDANSFGKKKIPTNQNIFKTETDDINWKSKFRSKDTLNGAELEDDFTIDNSSLKKLKIENQPFNDDISDLEPSRTPRNLQTPEPDLENIQFKTFQNYHSIRRKTEHDASGEQSKNNISQSQRQISKNNSYVSSSINNTSRQRINNISKNLENSRRKLQSYTKKQKMFSNPLRPQTANESPLKKQNFRSTAAKNLAMVAKNIKNSINSKRKIDQQLVRLKKKSISGFTSQYFVRQSNTSLKQKQQVLRSGRDSEKNYIGDSTPKFSEMDGFSDMLSRSLQNKELKKAE